MRKFKLRRWIASDDKCSLKDLLVVFFPAPCHTDFPAIARKPHTNCLSKKKMFISVASISINCV
jgi:hypothetical protein